MFDLDHLAQLDAGLDRLATARRSTQQAQADAPRPQLPLRTAPHSEEEAA